MPGTTTLYYDPVLDVHHRLPAAAALTTAFYAAPQRSDDARRLFEAACASAGFDREPELPLRPSRGPGSSLVLAREWGLAELDGRLTAAIEASWEPTWDRERAEFTWGLGLDEPHPRGQYNAFLAAAEAAGPGMWSAVSDGPVERCPQVVDVDFPDVALSRAHWRDGRLELRLAARRPDPRARTSFRVVGLAGRRWALDVVGDADVAVTGPDRAGEVSIEVPVDRIELTLRPLD